MSEQILTVKSSYPNVGNFFTDFISIPSEKLRTTANSIIIIYENEEIAQNFRKCSEKFFNHFNNTKVYDGGHLNSCSSEHYAKIFAFVEDNLCLPVFIGLNTQIISDLSQKLNSPIHHISNHVLPLNPDLPLHLNAFIGYQRHLCHYENIMELENHSYNSLSLGKMRTYPSLNEAVMRDSRIAYINFNVLKRSESSTTVGNLPTGLTSEELCQTSRYLGSAGKLKFLFVDGGYAEGDSYESGLLAAEVIWYFIEGFNLKSNKHPLTSSDFTEFIILSESIDSELIFLKSNTQAQWWLKVLTDTEPLFMACSLEEYEATLKDEVPDRIAKFIESLGL